MSKDEWGRVDEAGTVWVRVAGGEREVGSFPGAPPEEALAYFGRKYDELAGQITLLEQRVRTTDLPSAEALSSIARLHQTLALAHAVGDLGALARRLADLLTLVEERKGTQDAARAKAREQARGRKEGIVAEAERLAASTAWKVSGDRLRTLLDEWKAAPRLERRADDALWKRFSAARNAFDRARRQHFAGLDQQRDEAKAVKEGLVREAEALADSTDWGSTSGAYRELMTRWKGAGRAGKADEERLWQAFRAAQDRFFAARTQVFESRDGEQRENLAAKEGIASEAEALLPVSDLAAAKETLRGLQERWESIGHVPRDARPGVESRFRRVEDAVRAAEDARWTRTSPEARARAEAAVAQLQSSIAKLERDLSSAEASGNQRAAVKARAALEARRGWLVEAEKALAEFTA